jgi:hypothetical protein
VCIVALVAVGCTAKGSAPIAQNRPSTHTSSSPVSSAAPTLLSAASPPEVLAAPGVLAPSRRLDAQPGLLRLSWNSAVAWWNGASELLRASSFPNGPPRDETIVGRDSRKSGGDKHLLAIYSYGSGKAESSTYRQIIDSGGIVLTFTLIPQGETPPFFGPFWTTKTVQVRGHVARMFESRASNGANIEFRTIRWETPAKAADGTQVQFAIDLDLKHYTESETIRFVDQLQTIAEG